MSMTIAQAKSELMQIYGALSPNKQRAIDTLVKIEPCEDAISRQAVLDINESHHGQMSNHINHQIWQEIKDLQSVNPQEPKYCDRNICIKNEYNGIGCDECEVTKSQEPKTGHWTHDGSHWKNRFICSECNNKLYDEPTNYCPNCGCRMVEPQERIGEE